MGNACGKKKGDKSEKSRRVIKTEKKGDKFWKTATDKQKVYFCYFCANAASVHVYFLRG